MINNNVWFFSINNFLTAGSSSQAIEDVLAATTNVKKSDNKILYLNFLV